MGSNFLTPVANVLREHPTIDFVNQLHLANDRMVQQHAKGGRVRYECFPQCAEIKSNLRRVLRFTLPAVGTPEITAMEEFTDLLLTAALDADGDVELQQMRREVITHMMRFSSAAKRRRTRGGDLGHETSMTSVIDLPASDSFEAATLRLAHATLSRTNSNAVATAPAAVREMFASLGPDQFAEVARTIAPLRDGFDEVARRPHATAPQLTLAEPSQGDQLRTRALVTTRDMSMAAFEEEEARESLPGTASRRWDSIPSGVPFLLRLSGLQTGFCYLFHLNEADKLSVIFPSKLDQDNVVRDAVGSLQVPSRFYQGKQYMKFATRNLERETFYLLTTNTRLESCDGVGELPDSWQKLPAAQSRAILNVIRRHVVGSPVPLTRDMDASCMMDVDDAEGGVAMALSTLMLVSVGT